MAEDLDHAALALEIVRQCRPTINQSLAAHRHPAPALIALAQLAGDVIGIDATSPEHLEEGLRIFADLTSDQARGRYLSGCESSGSG